MRNNFFPSWECIRELQQQNKTIATPILGNEAGASLPV